MGLNEKWQITASVNRPKGVAAGTLRLVGTDEETIYRTFKELLEAEEACRKMAHACNPYGDGNACKRIADVVEDGECELRVVESVFVFMNDNYYLGIIELPLKPEWAPTMLTSPVLLEFA